MSSHPPQPPYPPQQPYGQQPPPPPGYPPQGGYPPPPGPYAQPPYPGQPLQYASPGIAPTTNLQCPRCGQFAAAKVGFTWWGGVLGPKMLNHHKCAACKYTFNGKTGQPNTTAIAIYTIVAAVIGLVVGILLFVA